MKTDIHPQYGTVLFRCASCGNESLIASTRLDGPVREHEGKEYPSMTLEICSQCHPFFSGKQMFVDTAGRVEKFHRRYGAGKSGQKKPEEAATAEATPQAEATKES